ncbi:DUF4230 domain-containing protein [Robiginitalea sp. SC105]|uniref:DUF4230 domain-containing protein n=1 Tax=Robiginitalea sp. SC105 TaxID=2762332 RepID=UPI001639F144|nr:DUF4230 domain-containing protein [Robiginitalea sp. SC105]MBC2837725.1 DUF4230 domain-containing protein [Robiginitalea sp. SC105]
MKRFLAGVLLALTAVLVYRSCAGDGQEASKIREESSLIQSRIDQVAKLVVTEGHYAEVYTYEDSRDLLGSLWSARKRALVVVNARATVSYDLKQLTYRLDPEARTLHILEIPEAEIDIYPELSYYDVTADYLNPFGAADYNTIKNRVSASIRKKVEASSLRGNARGRLLEELSGFWVLTRSMGWTLTYRDRPLDSLPGPGFFLD